MCRVPVNERRCRSNESCDDLDKKFIKNIRIGDEPFFGGRGGERFILLALALPAFLPSVISSSFTQNKVADLLP